MNKALYLRIGFALSLSSVAQCYEIGDLEGTWRVAGLDIPGTIVQNKNIEGIVVGLNGGDSFDVADGFLTIGPTGAITGNVGSALTGTASISTEGVVTLTINVVGEPTFAFSMPITTNADIMTTAHGDTDYNELLLMAKEPTNASLNDVIGSWWVMSMETPRSFGLQYNNGKVTNVDNANSFHQGRHTLVIDENARYNYNSGQELGDISVAPNGTMTLTPDNMLNQALELHLNKGKDVMMRAHASNDDQELVVLVKKHEVKHWEAAGQWTMASINLPGTISTSKNNNGYVLNINNLDGFRHRNGWIHFSLDGSLNGFLEQGFQGHTLSSLDGILPIYHGEPTPFTSAVNAGGDFFVGVGDGSEELEMIAAIRSVRPLEVAMSSENGLKVVWVPAPGRILQESSGFSGWQPVPGSDGTSSYAPTLGTDGSHHFYRLFTP